MRRCRATRSLAVASRDDGRGIGRRTLPLAHRHQGPNDRANHLVAKRGGSDLEYQYPLAIGSNPRQRLDPPDQAGFYGTTCAGTTTKGSEVVYAQKVSASLGHGLQVKPLGDMPGLVGQQGIWFRTVQNPVAVGPTSGAEPSIKVFGSDHQVGHKNRRPALGVDRAGQGPEVSAVRHIEADHLAQSMHAPVSSAGTRHGNRFADRPSQRFIEDTGHGGNTGIVGKPMEWGPVVCHPGPNSHVVTVGRLRRLRPADQTSSTRTIGALSPCRGPTLISLM